MGKKAAAIAKGAITVAAGVKAIRTAVNDRRNTVHRITWLDEDGGIIDISEVRHNEVPQHDALLKSSTEECDYAFDDWYPVRKPATEDAIYRARFLELRRNGDARIFSFYNHVTDENCRFVTYYNDGYFDTPSSGYNASLTTFALFLALSSGNKADDPSHNADFAIDLMRKIGCDRVEVNDYYLLDRKRLDDIGVVVGIKDADMPTVFILIRGSYYGSEFGGNLIVGTGKDSGGRHEGFSTAKDRAMEFVRSVLKKHGVEGRVRMMTTGYSRGGAVSNLVASTITDMILDGTVEDELGVSVIQDDMYGFCFEPALCQYDDSNRSDVYRNIVCVIDPNDIVAKVPPVQFGFTLYGRIYWLKTNDAGRVDLMRRYMDRYFGEGMSDFYNVVDFQSQSGMGTLDEMIGSILSKAVSAFGDRDHYAAELQDSLSYTVYSIIDNLDEAKRAFASLDPTNASFEDLVPVLFKKGPLIKRVTRHFDEFNILTNTDPNRMKPLISQAYDLIRRSKPEDVLAAFIAIRHNYKRIFTPHYPMGPISYLLSEDPNYVCDPR
ncbi:MAG: hypothetical protein IJL79_02320 [Candidatus Methanomethylophilaceae archaeon]|nr:hypothetical protein [Candidatus Methanomethylophilaceae archaeon]